MNRSKTLQSIVLSVAIAVLLAAAPASATKYAGEFLKIPVGPRAIGLGGAFTAIADDATAAYWNPAGMVYLPYREIVFQHQEKFGSLLNHDYLSVVYPLGGAEAKHSALGLSLVRLATDDIPVTPRPGGLVAGRDFLDYGTDNDETTPGNGQGNGIWDPGERLRLGVDDLFLASASDMAMLVSFARQTGTHLSFGGNLKFVRQSIPDTLPGQHVTSFGAGLDVGALWMPTDATTFGITVHDLTTTYLAWSNGTRELIVPTLDTGVAFNFFPAQGHALTWGVDVAWGFERRLLDAQLKVGAQTWDFRTGLEYWYKNTLALRSGLAGKDLTFGAGVRYKHFGADYAAQLNRFFAADAADFPGDRDLDATHLVALSLSW
jgi:hypothetical protein